MTRVTHLEGSAEGSRRALCGATSGRVRWLHEFGPGDVLCRACADRRAARRWFPPVEPVQGALFDGGDL